MKAAVVSSQLWVALLLVLLSAGAAAAAAPLVVVEVGTVLGSDTTKRIDQRLIAHGMQARLTRIFHYRSYEMMQLDARNIALGASAPFTLPGGLELRAHPRAVPAPGRVALRVELRQSEKILMDTILTLGDQGRVVLGGPGHDGGVLLIWVGARVAAEAGEAPALPADGPAVEGLVPAHATVE
jgi:hypothetical protein